MNCQTHPSSLFTDLVEQDGLGRKGARFLFTLQSKQELSGELRVMWDAGSQRYFFFHLPSCYSEIDDAFTF